MTTRQYCVIRRRSDWEVSWQGWALTPEDAWIALGVRLRPKLIQRNEYELDASDPIPLRDKP